MQEATTQGNNSSSEIPEPGGFQPETDIASIVLALAIVTLNGCILFLVRRKPPLRTVTNFFLASLATSDLLTGLYVIPTYLACKATERNGICQASVPLLTFTSLSTVSHITIVTTERYISIMFSLRHRALVTKSRAKAAIVTVWVIAMVLSLIQLAWARPGGLDVNSEGSTHFKRSEVAFSIFIIVVVLLPFPFLAYSYYRIYTEVRRHIQTIRINSLSTGSEQPSTHERRNVIVFILMLLAYTFCWMPNALIRYQYSSSAFELPEWAESVIIHFRFLTSLLNPCFCLFLKRDFLDSMACCSRRRNRGSQEEHVQMFTGLNEKTKDTELGEDQVQGS